MMSAFKGLVKAPSILAPSFDILPNKSLSTHLGFEQKPLVSQPPLIQRKLKIGEPDDEYEREADRVADKVMQMPEPSLQQTST